MNFKANIRMVMKATMVHYLLFSNHKIKYDYTYQASITICL